MIKYIKIAVIILAVLMFLVVYKGLRKSLQKAADERRG